AFVPCRVTNRVGVYPLQWFGQVWLRRLFDIASPREPGASLIGDLAGERALTADDSGRPRNDLGLGRRHELFDQPSVAQAEQRRRQVIPDVSGGPHDAGLADHPALEQGPDNPPFFPRAKWPGDDEFPEAQALPPR